jgi:hypothetical protein
VHLDKKLKKMLDFVRLVGTLHIQVLIFVRLRDIMAI